MLGETKKSFRVLGWCVIVVSLLLAINYFIWDKSFADTSDSYIKPTNIEENSSGKMDAEWDVQDSIVLDIDHVSKTATSSCYRFNAKDGVTYDIYDIYLTVSGDKITLHYRTSRGMDFNGIRFAYVMEFIIHDYDGNIINDSDNYFTTEWRDDDADWYCESDHETFNIKGDDWVVKSYDSPRRYINTELHAANIMDTDSKSLKTLINEGIVEVQLKKIMIDDD